MKNMSINELSERVEQVKKVDLIGEKGEIIYRVSYDDIAEKRDRSIILAIADDEAICVNMATTPTTAIAIIASLVSTLNQQVPWLTQDDILAAIKQGLNSKSVRRREEDPLAKVTEILEALRRRSN